MVGYLSSLVQRRLRGQLTAVLNTWIDLLLPVQEGSLIMNLMKTARTTNCSVKYLNRFTTAIARGLFDYDLNEDREDN